VDARPAPCLYLVLVCKGTRSSGCRHKDLLEGDSNTKYFQLVASGKYRKRRSFQLQQEDKIIEGEQALNDYITSYYKDMFGPPKILHSHWMRLEWMILCKCPKKKMIYSLDPSLLKRCERRYFKWNTTKHQVLMDS
jgi:hypothetical protein